MVSFRALSIAAAVNFLATPMCALPLNHDYTGLATSFSEKVLTNLHTSVSASPQQLAEGITGLTTRTFALHAPAMEISVVNGPLVIAGLGPYPPIIQGLTNIVQAGNELLANTNGMKEITSSSDADLVFNAYREFSRVQGTLLNILAGKASLFTNAPFVLFPTSSALRMVQGIDDGLGYSLTSILPKITADVQTEAATLAKAMDAALVAHAGLPA